MKKNYFLVALLALAFTSVNAQTVEFDDDMESYTDGSEIFEAQWTSWSGTSADAIFASSAQAQSGSLAGYVPDNGTTDGVLDLGSKIFGEWYLQFYMYVPSNKEAYWNLQGQVPIGAGEWVIGNVFFNQDLASPGVGLIDDSALGAVSFDFPHDEWFEVRMEWDINSGISLATWGMSVAGVEVIPVGTAFTSADGTTATSLGGFDFFSISANNEYWLDDVLYQDFPIDAAGTADFNEKQFSVYPNPVSNVLNLQAKEAISSVSIFNVLGQEVYNANIDALTSTVDMSNFASGAYFVKVNIGGTEGTVKVIK